MQCCLEPLGQHCTRILFVQFCPKCMKATLKSIFSCAMLSRASWTTLHKDFTYAVQCCAKCIKTSLNKFFPVQCCPKSIKTTLTRIFELSKNVMKDLTIKKYIKCFEVILFNGPFMILLVRFTIYRNAPYIWAEWIWLVLTSGKFDLFSNVLNVKIYPE